MVLLFVTLLILITYLLLVMPKVINTVDYSPFKGRYYAHRGLHQKKSISPENSMAAFKLAKENNFGIEFDVQLTKDHVPVVFHDFTLKRVCGVDKNVSDLTYKEIKNFALYNSKEKIPHLKDLLDLIDGQVPLIVELKGQTNTATLASIVASYMDKYNGVYCIESFNPLLVLWYKKNRPHIVRGQLVIQSQCKENTFKIKIRNFILGNLLFNFMTKPDFVAYHHLDPDVLSFIICKKLYRVFTVAYTIQSNKDLKANLNRFDLFIFDKFIPNLPISHLNNHR